MSKNTEPVVVDVAFILSAVTELGHAFAKTLTPEFLVKYWAAFTLWADKVNNTPIDTKAYALPKGTFLAWTRFVCPTISEKREEYRIDPDYRTLVQTIHPAAKDKAGVKNAKPGVTSKKDKGKKAAEKKSEQTTASIQASTLWALANFATAYSLTHSGLTLAQLTSAVKSEALARQMPTSQVTAWEKAMQTETERQAAVTAALKQKSA
jgi:hypothetical protein